MPVDQDTTLNITCDNEACPGNSLDATDRTGWTFVNAEVYGEPGHQFVYCSSDCAATVGPALDAKRAEADPIL
jgi:hypothetical protein